MASVTADDLVETRAGAALVTLTRGQETELPAAAKIGYVAGGQDYRPAIAEARRQAGRSGRIAQAELPLVLDDFQAEATAETFLFEAWASRERARMVLPPSMIAVEPGDMIEIADGGGARLVRVVEIGDHGAREVEARSIDPDIYGLQRASMRPGRSGAGGFIGQPLAILLDLPMLRGDEPPEAGYVAATQTPWTGGVAFYRSPEQAGFVLKAIASAPATIGTTLDPLPAGPEWRMDHASRPRVELSSGQLVSVTRLQLLGGANTAAIETSPGMWEVIQFETATLIAPRTYELSGLLRGQAGTEHAMAGSLQPGARFVLIDGALTRVSNTLDEIGLPFNWKVGPAKRNLGDPSYVGLGYAFRGEGLRPLSPAHVRGVRDGDGNLAIGWVRRTRTGGDTWETSEVPLSEAVERYEIDVLDGAEVRRTVAVTSASVTYSAADQTADFGSPQASVAVRVHQLSSLVGRGAGRIAIV